MTQSHKKALIILALFVTAVLIMLLTAYSVGADPFQSDRLHIWALSLVAAAYFSFRAYTIYKKISRGREDWGASGWWPRILKSQHPIDQRMAARRERVEAAREKSKNTETSEGSAKHD